MSGGPCFVYFVQAGDGGNIKIGISMNVQSRLKKMQTDASSRLKVLLTICGDEADERAFHKELKRHRAHGEWFYPDDEVFALIAREKASRGNVEHIRAKKTWTARTPLEAWRRARGLTVAQLANLLDLSQGFTSDIESGKTPPGWTTLEVIYRATDGAITPNDFAAFMREPKEAVA